MTPELYPAEQEDDDAAGETLQYRQSCVGECLAHHPPTVPNRLSQHFSPLPFPCFSSLSSFFHSLLPILLTWSPFLPTAADDVNEDEFTPPPQSDAYIKPHLYEEGVEATSSGAESVDDSGDSGSGAAAGFQQPELYPSAGSSEGSDDVVMIPRAFGGDNGAEPAAAAAAPSAYSDDAGDFVTPALYAENQAATGLSGGSGAGVDDANLKEAVGVIHQGGNLS